MGIIELGSSQPNEPTPLNVVNLPDSTPNPPELTKEDYGIDVRGTITITADGGIPPYTYSIDGVTYQSSNIFTDVDRNNITIYIKDDVGTIVTIEGIDSTGIIHYVEGVTAIPVPTSLPSDPQLLTEETIIEAGSPIVIPETLPADPIVLTEETIVEAGSPIAIPEELPSDPIVLTDITIAEDGSPVTIPTLLPTDPTLLTDGIAVPTTKTDGFTIGAGKRIPFVNGNGDDFAYDTDFQYIASTDTLNVSNISLSGLATLNSMRLGSQTVDTIETSLTDDDTHLPTSGAVYDAIAALAHGNHTGQVTSVNMVTALTVSAITGQPNIGGALVSTDELMVNDGGVLRRMDISVLQTYMQNNLSLTPYTHPNHTGQVLSTGDGATVLDSTAITAQTLLATALLGSDEMLMSDAGSIRRMSITTLQAYMQANLTLGAGVSDHGALSGLGDDDHSIYYNAARLTAWTGSTNITTLGTIGTGVWQGSVIGQAYTLPAQATHAGEFLTTNGTVASWGTFTGVTDVTGGYGITSTGGATPDIALDGTELDIDDLTAWGGTSYIMFVAGAVTERVRTTTVPISTWVNDSNYTANLGTVTNVSASTPLASSGGTTPNISFDASSVPTKGGALLEDDFLMTIDGVSGAMEKKAIEFIPLGEFNNDEGWASGTVESVLGGYGIVSDADPVNPSLSFDASELDIDDGTAFAGTSYFVFRAGAVSELRRTTSVAISTFVNDTGFTTNTGTVTNVSASSPLASSGGTTPNITFDASSIATKGGAVLEDDFLVTIDGVSGAMEKKALEFIPLSEFNTSGLPYVDITGDTMTGALIVQDNITATGSMFADSTFASTDTLMFLGTTGSGNVYIRPAGYGSATDQSVFGTALFTVGTDMTVYGGTVSTFTVYGDTTSAAWAAGIVLKSAQEQRGRGIFYTSDANSSEWFSGIAYNAANDYVIGYDAAGGQGEYTANSIVRVTPAGNVGIGADPSNGKLQVGGGSGTQIAIQRTPGEASIKAYSDGYMFIDSASGYASINHYVSDHVVLGYGGGSVGIGDVSPSYRLDVAGDGRFTTNLFVNNELTVNGYWQIIDLPSMNMGASGVTDEYLVLARKWISGTGFPAYGYNGSLHMQRGGVSSGNSICKIDLVFQCAYSTNYLEAFTINGTQMYTQIDEIEISSVKYYALKARTSGGGHSLSHQWVGDHYNSDSDANILTRVRASDGDVTVTVSGAWMPDLHSGSARTIEGSISASAEITAWA